MIRRISSQAEDFDSQLEHLLAYDEQRIDGVNETVSSIISAVRIKGDQALLDYTAKLDRWEPQGVKALKVDLAEADAALSALPADERKALRSAAERIRRYHEHQTLESWQYQEADGTVLGQKITALRAVGVYVPGGQASYPSTVLMNAIPARVAGVERICMCVPTPGGEIMPLVLAAAAVAGVDEIWRVGGAQAIAALAYGTDSISPVDKIVGPGNIYVATAKQQVFGRVGLDMLAGPSEILIISDGNTDPDWLVKDMFAQAEHDAMAQSILMSPDAAFLDRVAERITELLPDMQREAIIAASLADRGALIKVESLGEAAEIANTVAAEHLQLAVDHPEDLLGHIDNAGAIFMGHHSAEAFGDYCAGPNHVLPTSGAARFSSPLGVYDFQKRSSLIHCSAKGAEAMAETAGVLAFAEGLEAHALSALARRPNTD